MRIKVGAGGRGRSIVWWSEQERTRVRDRVSGMRGKSVHLLCGACVDG